MFRRRRTTSDFNAEIDAHIQLEIERLREQGLSARDAEAAARRSFGHPTIAAERYYEKSRWLWLDHLRQDLRYAFRLMTKNPTLSAIIVLPLALGIGANWVIFSVVRAVVLRPLDYRDPDRLVQLWDSGKRSGGESDWVSFPDFRDWRRENRVFEDIAAYNFALLTMTGGGREAESALGLQVTDRLFSILGVEPEAGRTFLPGEDTAGHENVVVISHAFRHHTLQADPSVAGQPLHIYSRPCTV